MLKRLENTEDLPELPSVLSRFNEAISNPGCTINDIIHVVSEDPSIVANLLRVVNSSLYSSSSGDPIDSPDAAVFRLGLAATRGTVISNAILKPFRGLKDSALDFPKFWMHSLAVGTVGAIVYECCSHRVNRILDSSQIQLAGMVHDIGKAILALFFPDELHEILKISRRENIPFYVAEHNFWSSTHCELGRWIANRWGLDEPIIHSIQWHHDPQGAPEEDHALASIIHAADHICNRRKLGESGNYFTPPLLDEVAAQLQLDKNMMDRISREIQTRNVRSTLSLSLRS